MKVIIAGSISAAQEILGVRDTLTFHGHTVEIPEGVKNQELRGRTEVSPEEKAGDKIKHDLIRGYYEKIKQYDALLVVNPDKRGVSNYIGANTLIEMAFAHALNKPVYCLNPLPDMPYTAEILAMRPIVLNGNLDRLR